MSDLPTWVWDMLIELEDQRDTHPKLYDHAGEPLGWCPCAPLDKVPPEVVTQARVIREYVQAKERDKARAEAEG